MDTISPAMVLALNGMVKRRRNGMIELPPAVVTTGRQLDHPEADHFPSLTYREGQFFYNRGGMVRCVDDEYGQVQLDADLLTRYMNYSKADGGDMAEYPTGPTLALCVPGVDTAELVQKGGQKAVYKATIEGQVTALKVIGLAPEEADAEEDETDMSSVAERAQREVSILAQVDVPVLAKCGPLGLSMIEIGEARWLYFTEEWIEGRNLRDMIHEGRLPPDQVARLGVDLVMATDWLSSRNLVRRDIKPANIMWATDSSRFVLLDPGIALDLYGPSLTRFPLPVGTAAYFSPEQMDPSRKRSLDFRSDLFAIGVVLYEAALAEHPFMAVNTTLPQVMAGILNKNPQPVTDRVVGFPPALSEVIARLLGKAPHLRYRTCAQALSAIEGAAASLGVGA